MSLPENSQSASDAIELLNASVPPTPPGASGDAAGFVDDEPMCMHSVTPVSLHTWNTGSQPPLWIVGSLRWCGSSLKQNARTPRSALRWISAAASSTSHSGMMQSGMFMPPRRRAPLLDHPVVVRLHAREPELLVVAS